MNILVFKTDLETDLKVRNAASILDEHQGVERWNVDLDDIDNVLRIEAASALCESEVEAFMRENGVRCQALPD